MSTLSLHPFPPALFVRESPEEWCSGDMFIKAFLNGEADTRLIGQALSSCRMRGWKGTDLERPTSIDNISPRKVLEDDGERVPCFTN